MTVSAQVIVKSCGNGVRGEAVPSQAGWFRCLSQHCRCSCHRPTVSQALALKTCCMSWRTLAVSISQSPRESACCDMRVNSSGGCGRGLSTGCVIRNRVTLGSSDQMFYLFHLCIYHVCAAGSPVHRAGGRGQRGSP